MCKLNKKNAERRIDPCLREQIKRLDNFLDGKWTSVASCCGHGKYKKTIVIINVISGEIIDMISGKSIPRKTKFYKKDKQGFYFIPEVL